MTETDIPDELRPRGLDDHERLNDPRYRLIVANQTIAALRRELEDCRETSARQAQELRACQEEKGEAERAHHRELAARTEERDAANLALKYARAALDSRRSVIP